MRKSLLVILIFLSLNIASSLPVQAATFSVDDAASLIAAIEDANAGAGADVITLTADILVSGIYDYNLLYGNIGLPVITSNITINGNGFTIERDVHRPTT